MVNSASSWFYSFLLFTYSIRYSLSRLKALVILLRSISLEPKEGLILYQSKVGVYPQTVLTWPAQKRELSISNWLRSNLVIIDQLILSFFLNTPYLRREKKYLERLYLGPRMNLNSKFASSWVNWQLTQVESPKVSQLFYFWLIGGSKNIEKQSLVGISIEISVSVHIFGRFSSQKFESRFRQCK